MITALSKAGPDSGPISAAPVEEPSTASSAEVATFPGRRNWCRYLSSCLRGGRQFSITRDCATISIEFLPGSGAGRYPGVESNFFGAQDAVLWTP
jgi:hypothetical protein